MNLDHFRPKGNPNFAHLVNDPSNLVWSCRRCNGLKLDHWPAIDIAVTFIDNYGFIDPFGVNRLDYFFVDDSGELHPLQPPAAYMIDLLGLNSHTPQVKRRQRIEAANQVIQIDEMLFKLNQQHELTEEQENWIDLLRKNRVVLERVLDFDLY